MITIRHEECDTAVVLDSFDAALSKSKIKFNTCPEFFETKPWANSEYLAIFKQTSFFYAKLQDSLTINSSNMTIWKVGKEKISLKRNLKVHIVKRKSTTVQVTAKNVVCN